MAANSKGDVEFTKSPKVASSSDSDSSNTSEEERLRRLFQTCDADGDGFLEGNDFVYMCSQLNMEDSAQEIMSQLGVTTRCPISFSDFLRCRSRIMLEAGQSPYVGTAADDTGIDSDTSGFQMPSDTGGFQIPSTQNITSWPTMSSDSLGAHSGKPESVDYDSGARDLCSPEPVSLAKLMESHDPGTIKHMTESCSTVGNFMELANRLHLAALTSLKGEIIDLNNRLQHVSSERDLFENQLAKVQAEKLRYHHEWEDKVDETAARYEERITELHSVIAELRKKIERHQINVIREEDEYEESDKSNDGGSVNENNANGSQSASCEIGNEINAEFTRVVSALETAIAERKEMAIGVDEGERDAIRRLTQFVDNDSVDDRTREMTGCMNGLAVDGSQTASSHHAHPAAFHPPPPPPPNQYPDPEYLQEEVNSLRSENNTLQEQMSRQEVDVNTLRSHVEAICDEREKLKRKVRDLQTRLQVKESSSSPNDSRTSTPTKAQLNQVSSRDQSLSSNDQFPVAKIAELKKLKTYSGDRPVLGNEITALGLPNTKVAEHLVQSLQECSNMQEIVQTLYKCGSEISETKVKEFEIEFERLQSKIDHLKSQNDLLILTLDESKSYSERLTVLMGKYESNNTALNLAINYSDQAIEAYEVLCALCETEMGVLLANCRAAGLGSLVGGSGVSNEENEITLLLQRAHHARKAAENVAKHMMHKMDRFCGHVTGCTASPWEDLSSNSRTASTGSSTASSVDADFSKMDEQRLREHIQSLKNDRVAVKMTVLELESVHIDPMADEPRKMPEAQRLDLENAVLMQELMAMKEEKAELKAANYLMEKEKRAVELRLSGKESHEQAYRVQIEHLKCELSEVQQQKAKDDAKNRKNDDGGTSPSISVAELRTNDSCDLAQDLNDALKREKKLKSRVQDLVSTLEKISRNSEIRHQQSAEFVNDLKRANSALISAFDKAKKKYQSKLKKLEVQLQAMTERYETQIRMLKQRIGIMENGSSPCPRQPTNETSL